MRRWLRHFPLGPLTTHPLADGNNKELSDRCRAAAVKLSHLRREEEARTGAKATLSRVFYLFRQSGCQGATPAPVQRQHNL